jgi:hypothetical protein
MIDPTGVMMALSSLAVNSSESDDWRVCLEHPEKRAMANGRRIPIWFSLMVFMLN